MGGKYIPASAIAVREKYQQQAKGNERSEQQPQGAHLFDQGNATCISWVLSLLHKHVGPVF
jgi:hypothetical protein